jgi:alpha-galactosidase
VKRRSIFVPALFCSVLAALSATAQVRAKLSTADTVLQFEASEHAPQLTTVQHPRSPVWTNDAPEELIPSAEVNGKQVPLTWRINRRESHASARRVSFVYECRAPRLRLRWIWNTPADFGPIEHTIEIQNLSGKELGIPLQDSFRYRLQTDPTNPLTHLYVEKGADTPSAVGTHEVKVPDGYSWIGFSSTYAHKHDDDPREIIPFSLVQRRDTHPDGWFVGMEFSGRVRFTLEHGANVLSGRVGLNPSPGPFRTRLAPNQTFTTPTVFVGAFSGDAEDAGNELRHWVAKVLGNPATWRDPRYPFTVNNSWGSGMAVDEPMALRMIRDSAELGLEMFHIDAGWFRAVGDWYPDPKKFPHGLAPIADEAHKRGLKFGIWVDWTQAGISTQPDALNARNPKFKDWLITKLPPDWKPEEFKGETTDIGYPPAKAWAQRQLERMVSNFHLDMLEHDGYLVAQGCVQNDHPHAPPDPAHLELYKDAGFNFSRSTNSTDVSYHSTRAYYDIYTQLRKNHPGLLLEVCNDGGRMVDFGSAAHADYFSITDTYDPLSNRRAFFDTSHVLPAPMLESYVEKWPTPKIENFLYMLRSGMMGWLTIMQDTTAWNEEQHRAAKEEIQLYKSSLRPLIRTADLYHISSRPDGEHWDAIEYFDPARGTGVVYAFRGSVPNQDKYSFLLRGLRADRSYRVRFHDHTSVDGNVSGATLMREGLTVNLAIPLSSELIFFDEIKAP